MSYNLFIEGVDSYAPLCIIAARYPVFEMFPIPDDALGIALPSSRAGDGAAHVVDLVHELLDAGLRVHDLYTGRRLQTDEDLAELAARLRG
jgi:hypothetical protein